MVSLTNYGNIGTNNSFGLNLFGSVNIQKKFAVSGSFNLYTYHPQVYPNYNIFLNPGIFYQYNGLMSGSYKFNKGVAVETVYSFQSKVRTFQGTTSNLNILNVGIKKAILKQKGTIGLVAVNPFHNKWNFTDYIHTSAIIQYNNFSTPFRSFNLNFVYRFGKLKMKPANQRGVNNDDLKEGQGD